MKTAIQTRDGGDRTWSRLGSLPRCGWDLISVEDRGEPDFECEACGYTEVRYVHVLMHPENDDTISVGSVCCERLTQDYANPRDAERRLRNRANRLRRLIDLDNWRETRNGNLRIKYQGTLLVLYESRFNDTWRINVGESLGRLDHETPRDAIRAAFAYLDLAKVYRGTGTDGDPKAWPILVHQVY